MKKAIIAGGLMLFIFSCSTRTQGTASTVKPVYKLTEQQFATAKNLLKPDVVNVMICQNLRIIPRRNGSLLWIRYLKAKLTDEEKNWVLAYVSTNAKTELK